MENKAFISSKIKILLCKMTLLFVMSLGIYAQNRKFEQKIQWQSEKNASEYKVEIVQNIPGGKSIFFETEETFLSLSLAAGLYKYRVYAYDFLGRESSVSEWTDFEIIKAKVPVVKTSREEVEFIAGEETGISIPVEIISITEDSSVELVNSLTKEVIPGKLVTEKKDGEVKANKAEFEKISTGEWKLKITNPSGLIAFSDAVNVVEKQPEPEPAQEPEPEPAQVPEPEPEVQNIPENQNIPEVAEIIPEPVVEEKEEKIRKPYKFKDMELLAGGGILLAPFENCVTEDSEKQFMPFVMAKLNVFPVKKENFKVGLEADAKLSYVEGKNEYYELLYPFGIIELNFVYQKNIYKNKIFVNTKAGANVFLLNRQLKYSETSGRKNPEEKTYGYIGAQAGIGLHFVPVNFLAFEIGFDYDHIFMDENKTAFLCPYAGLGVRW